MAAQPGSALLKRVKSLAPVLSPRLGILTLMHLLVDLHSGMLPVLLLYQRHALDLSLTQVGVIAGVYNFVLSLAQPFFGYLADRYGERYFAFGGVIWIALLGTGLGFTGDFRVLLLLAPLAALGSSSFHPAGATGVSHLASTGRGSAMSFFLVGGSVGFALGPLVAVAVFERFGLHGTVWIGLAALVTGALLITLMRPLWQSETGHSGSSKPAGISPWRTMVFSEAVLGGVIALILLSGARAWIYQGLSNFMPLQMTALGFARVEATHWLSAMLFFNAAGVLIGGQLTDRFGPRAVMAVSLVLAIPVLILTARAGPDSAGLLACLADFLVGLPVATVILVGQSFLPRGAGLASGLVLGISFTIGAIGIALTGVIADHWGLSTAVLSFGLLALIAAVCGLAMPRTIQVPSVGQEITSASWME